MFTVKTGHEAAVLLSVGAGFSERPFPGPHDGTLAAVSYQEQVLYFELVTADKSKQRRKARKRREHGKENCFLLILSHNKEDREHRGYIKIYIISAFCIQKLCLLSKNCLVSEHLQIFNVKMLRR